MGITIKCYKGHLAAQPLGLVKERSYKIGKISHHISCKWEENDKTEMCKVPVDFTKCSQWNSGCTI